MTSEQQPCKKRKTDCDDSIESMEESLARKKREVRDLENRINLLKASHLQHGISSLEASLLRYIVNFLNSREIFSCLWISKHWYKAIDDPKVWKGIAKSRHDSFVAYMESKSAVVPDYRKIVKRLAANRPERSWRGDVDAPVDSVGAGSIPTTLVATDLFLLVQVKDNATGNEIDFRCKSFEDLLEGRLLHCINFGVVPDAEWRRTQLPVQLSGEYRDHFNRWNDWLNGSVVPVAVVDSIRVTVRLWRQDKQQALCLCSAVGQMTRHGCTALQTSMTSFPTRRANSDAVVARFRGWYFALQCTIRCHIGSVVPEHNEGDLDAWKRVRFFLRSMEVTFGCCSQNGVGSLGSGENLLTLLNVLDWE